MQEHIMHHETFSCIYLFQPRQERREREKSATGNAKAAKGTHQPTITHRKKNRNGSGGRGSKRRGVGGVLLAGVFTDCPFWADPFSLFIPLLFVAQE
jgi:hypothetical protein